MSTGQEGGGSKANQEFVSEAEDILERMRDDLSEIAEASVAGQDPDPDSINRLFRSAHSLKGLSGMFGMGGLSDLAHHLEDVLDALRMGRLPLTEEALGLFDAAITVVAASLFALDGNDGEASADASIRDLLVRIENWTAGASGTSPAAEETGLPDSMLRALTEYEEHRLRENQRRGWGIYIVDVDFEIANFEDDLASVSSAIKEVGEILSTLPSPGDTPGSHIRFSLLTATELGRVALAETLSLPLPAVAVGWTPAESGNESAAEGAEDVAIETTEEPAPAQRAGSDDVEATTDRVVQEPGSLKSISDTVRVDIKKLDELMNLVGELAIQKGAIKRLAVRLSEDRETSRIGADLDKMHRSLERKLGELQAGVLEVRMVPLRQVFDKLNRVVRRLRLDLRKEVELELRGADTELDKLIVEELVDPLMHVVRNAFDHAIESPSERADLGKPPSGVIQIEALQRGNDVVIVVRDDGRGMDPERILARAKAGRLISEDAELTKKETLDLILQPGFSTREDVTETSGRGVGMDVVRSNIASLGGIVDIESQLGQGTSITITLPITLAIIQALIVGVGAERFAVPLNAVRESLLIEPDEIQYSEGRELLNLRGQPVPLRRLSQEFDIDPSPGEGKYYVVILGIGDLRMGLLVDRLEGQQDTVIKPIQGPARKVRGIAGATELAEQGAVLVLDVSALIEDLGKRIDG